MDEQRILDRYRLIERLAVGGSAEVWRAQDEQLRRPVAVKRLHPHLFADEGSRARLAAEARAAARLSHPVIVDVYDVDATGEAPALVMELVDGESLAGRLERDGLLPPRMAAGIVADLSEALYHAHQRGVIHRDVKPGNVLLARDGRTRLVDFGIAHSLAEAAQRLTLTGTVVGTLRSMAPEQLAGGAITPRTDLYGLGVVLHEALTGRPPYAAPTPVALAEAQRDGPPPLEAIDPALAAVTATCLAYEPTARPLHAGALAAALRSWLGGDPRPALALAPVPRDTDPAAATQTMPMAPVVASVAGAAPSGVPSAAAGAPMAVRRRKSWAPLLLLLALGVVALLVGAAWLASDPTPRAAGPSGAPPTISPAPAPPSATSAPPEWLAKLVEEVAKECDTDAVAAAREAMAAMTEDQAKDHAESLVKACRDAESGGGGNGNDGGGNGNDGGGGGGGGNGGGGNGDD